MLMEGFGNKTNRSRQQSAASGCWKHPNSRQATMRFPTARSVTDFFGLGSLAEPWSFASTLWPFSAVFPSFCLLHGAVGWWDSLHSDQDLQFWRMQKKHAREDSERMNLRMYDCFTFSSFYSVAAQLSFPITHRGSSLNCFEFLCKFLIFFFPGVARYALRLVL
jgi:hypothetical protein